MADGQLQRPQLYLPAGLGTAAAWPGPGRLSSSGLHSPTAARVSAKYFDGFVRLDFEDTTSTNHS